MLDYTEYETVVAPILSAHGCAADGNCHGGGIRGTLELSPLDDKDLQFDFEQISLQVDGLTPEESALLLKPLAELAGGDPHSYQAFASVTHADYQAILTWIENGSFQ